MPLAALKSNTKVRSAETYWTGLTEEQLLQVQFTTSEPERLPAVSDAPPPAGEARVEFYYDVHGRPQGKAICAHCRFPNHFRGFVVMHADGSRRLVGKDCAHKLYGARFEDLEKDFKQARERAGFLHRQQRIIGASGTFFAHLELLELSAVCSDHERLRELLARVFSGPLLAMLCDAASDGDPLTVVEQVRDLAAEERAAAAEEPFVAHLTTLKRKERKKFRRQHGLRRGEIYVDHHREVGRLKGRSLFLRRRAPNIIIAETERELRNLVAAMRIPVRRSLKAHAASQKRLSELLSTIEGELVRLGDALSFFEPQHREMLVGWARHHQSDANFAHGDRWIERESEEGTIRAWIPAGYSVPNGDFIRNFRSEMSASGGRQSETAPTTAQL